MTAGQPGAFAAPSAPVPAPASGLPVLPALRGLLARGGLPRGSVDGPGARLRRRGASRRWTGRGDGQGRRGACGAQVVADGRGEAARTRTHWLGLPGEDGGVAVADPADLPLDPLQDPAAPALR